MRSDLADKIRNYNRFHKKEEIAAQVDTINEDIETKYYSAIKKKLFKKTSKLTRLFNKKQGSGKKRDKRGDKRVGSPKIRQGGLSSSVP